MTSPIGRPGGRGKATHQGARCMFCGAFAFETRLLMRSKNLMCEECFEKTGRLFSSRGETPRKARSERCIVCHRLLVGGSSSPVLRHRFAEDVTLRRKGRPYRRSATGQTVARRKPECGTLIVPGQGGCVRTASTSVSTRDSGSSAHFNAHMRKMFD